MTTRAGTRDASWWNHPNVHSGVRVHVNTGDDFAVCSPVPLGSLSWEAHDVPEAIRCGRAACQKAYAEADREPDDSGS